MLFNRFSLYIYVAVINYVFSNVTDAIMTSDIDDTKESSDEQEENIHFPQTYIVVKLAKNINHTTLTWLVEKITGKRRDGGAELIIRQEPYDPNEV